MLEDPVAREELIIKGEIIKSGPIGGNNTTKLKWTRLIQMDCGLGASNKMDLMKY